MLFFASFSMQYGFICCIILSRSCQKQSNFASKCCKSAIYRYIFCSIIQFSNHIRVREKIWWSGGWICKIIQLFLPKSDLKKPKRWNVFQFYLHHTGTFPFSQPIEARNKGKSLWKMKKYKYKKGWKYFGRNSVVLFKFSVNK